jgi:hypothetical protein
MTAVTDLAAQPPKTLRDGTGAGQGEPHASPGSACQITSGARPRAPARSRGRREPTGAGIGDRAGSRRRGVGRSGGDVAELAQTTEAFIAEAQKRPELGVLFTSFQTNTPRMVPLSTVVRTELTTGPADAGRSTPMTPQTITATRHLPRRQPASAGPGGIRVFAIAME